MGAPYYATVAELKAATDYKTTAYESDRLKRLLDGASRYIDELCHRHFYPLTETVTFTDPPSVTLRRVTSSGFWLDRDLLALTACTVDDVTQTVADVELYPSHYGPPYSWIGVTGSDIDVTGRWGYSENTTPAGALAAALDDTTGTTVDVTDGSVISIGDLIKVDSEQMLVTEQEYIDTTLNAAAGTTADVSDNFFEIDDGTAVYVGELLLLDGERMLIVDIAGNDITVKRAYDGSVLASHNPTVDIYAPRRLTVERGAVGTTAATHSNSAAITKNVPPALIRDLCIAEAITRYEQESSGYGRTVGSGDNQREARGAGIQTLRRDVLTSYRRIRTAAIR